MDYWKTGWNSQVLGKHNKCWVSYPQLGSLQYHRMRGTCSNTMIRQEKKVEIKMFIVSCNENVLELT